MRLPRPLLLLATLPAALHGQGTRAPYQDPARPIEARVADLLPRLTPTEKFWQLYLHPGDSSSGRGAGPGRYGIQVQAAGGAIEALRQVNRVQADALAGSRLGIPLIPVAEALHGVVGEGATAFPQAIALAATWDTALMREVATAIATEARARGIRQVLSPVLNLATDARWGRVEETYGEDPWLAGLMGQAFIQPFEQRGIVTTPKHFVANVGDGGRDSYPIEWSERRLRERELPPFRHALREGGARGLMAAYNSVDGRPASASAWLLRDVLRGEWGFGGVVMSDAGGVGGANVLHGTATDYADATAQAMAAGLDVIFQGDAASAPLFQAAFERGLVAPAVIDSAVARVLRLKFALGLFEAPYTSDTVAHALAADTLAHALARRAAIQSAVLLRNARRTLPLDPRRVRRMALIGVDADEARLGGYSGSGRRLVSARAALEARLGAARVRYQPGPGRSVQRYVTVPDTALSAAGGVQGLVARYYAGPDFGRLAEERLDSRIDFHWTFLPPAATLDPSWFSARWHGVITSPVSGPARIGLVGTDGYRLWLNDSLVIDAWGEQGASERLVPVRLVAGRGIGLRLEARQPAGNGRIRLVWDVGVADEGERRIADAVAAARAADVAVVMAGLEEGEFRDRASLALPGRQEELIRRVAATGTPVVVVIVGGGAVTMRPWLDRVAAVLDLWYPGEAGGEALAALLFGAASPGGRLPITFPVAEGQLPLVYNHLPSGRGDDYDDLTGLPQFPFGFGLGYTTFAYDSLRILPDTVATGSGLQVRCTITNTGTRAGDEVAQLYLRDPVASVSRPVMQLAGFQRVHLAPGESREVRFRVEPDQLAVLDVALRPVVEPGRLEVLVGASSRDLRLRGVATLR
ncbi:MAG: glycoside hydrolase family 3 C-terminal domain-containing protein [Gemmatimonadetes bacterium]|nr:glycoside hydrolase family 3 C-terminal domain-containing protein [Gemmatimonadota bacterium]